MKLDSSVLVRTLRILVISLEFIYCHRGAKISRILVMIIMSYDSRWFSKILGNSKQIFSRITSVMIFNDSERFGRKIPREVFSSRIISRIIPNDSQRLRKNSPSETFYGISKNQQKSSMTRIFKNQRKSFFLQ